MWPQSSLLLQKFADRNFLNQKYPSYTCKSFKVMWADNSWHALVGSCGAVMETIHKNCSSWRAENFVFGLFLLPDL